MNGLDLFSGIGGLSLALKPWVRTVAYCERDRYAQGVLLSRMSTGELDRVPIWDDITSLSWTMLPSIDIIFGGFPCQDISVAGRGKGLDGERSGLYWQLHRLIIECQPSFVFLENVPAIRTRGLERVVRSLTELGYDCRWTVVSAAEVGASHLRKRWFLLAYADSRRLREKQRTQLQGPKQEQRQIQLDDFGASQSVAHTNSVRELSKQNTREESFNWFGHSGRWKTEPDVGRVADGIQFRLDRIKCLGNAVVPIQAQKAFMKLIKYNEMTDHYCDKRETCLGE